MRDTCVCVRVIAALIALLLGRYAPITTDAAASVRQRVPVGARANGSAVTSYYQHDPYGPSTYAFGYEVHDNRTGNVQFRDERRYMNGSTLGSYGYVRPDGRITITHFASDALSGYRSQTRTYDRNENAQQWTPHWPTMRPAATDVLFGDAAMHEQMPLNVTHDAEQRLNVTLGGVNQTIADAVQQQHGITIDATPGQLVGQVLAPSLIDILNGKVPVQKKPVQAAAAEAPATVGFETVHNFIPSDFPLTPFHPPAATITQTPTSTSTTSTITTPTPTTSTASNIKGNKYDRAKENNAEKVPYLLQQQPQQPPQPLPLSTHYNNNSNNNNEPAPLSAPAGVGGQQWYDRIISATRREFLENLPNLQ